MPIVNARAASRDSTPGFVWNLPGHGAGRDKTRRAQAQGRRPVD